MGRRFPEGIGGSRIIPELDRRAAAARKELRQFLWMRDEIPRDPVSLVIQHGLTIPNEPLTGSTGTPSNYELSGAFSTPALHHYESWATRPWIDIANHLYLDNNGVWGWEPFPGTPGTGPYVRVLYFAPTTPTNKLFIVHDGHSPYGQPGHRLLIKWALEHGFGVVQTIMPHTVHNFAQVDIKFLPGGQEGAPSTTGTGLRVFFDATAIAIAKAETLGYTTFIMEGISGGGWTTHLYAAMDTRIRGSFPISGAMPFDMRLPQDVGDWEQTRQILPFPPLANMNAGTGIFNFKSDFKTPSVTAPEYDDYFALSASDNRFACQILSEFDPCCVAAVGRHAAIDAYATKANLASTGTYKCLIDMASFAHDVSANMIAFIEAELIANGVL